MARARQILLAMPQGDTPVGEMPPPLGRRGDVRKSLARFNTHPAAVGEGTDRDAMGVERLYGPGFIIEMPTSIDEVNQILATVDDEETAWPVLNRLCREIGWSMSDPESGTRFV